MSGGELAVTVLVMLVALLWSVIMLWYPHMLVPHQINQVHVLLHSTSASTPAWAPTYRGSDACLLLLQHLLLHQWVQLVAQLVVLQPAGTQPA